MEKSQIQVPTNGRVTDPSGAAKKTYQPKMLSSQQLLEKPASVNWLVNGLLMKCEPIVIGAPKKTLKTAVAADLAISLATGCKFLGKFAIPVAVNVGFFSGESGQATIKSLVTRIGRSKNVDISKCPVSWGFELPKLGSDASLNGLTALIKRLELEVLIIDPMYLCLFAGMASPGPEPSNLFAVGPILSKASRACFNGGATLVLVHHSKKTGGAKNATDLDLDDLAFAGIGEFARQWILLGRRKRYVAGSGFHELAMSCGSSIGCSSAWDLVIDEGPRGPHSLPSNWDVSVTPAS